MCVCVIWSISSWNDRRKEDLRLDPYFPISMGDTKKELSLSARLSAGLRAAGCWLTCRILWHQQCHLGGIMVVPPQRLTKLHCKELCHSGPSAHLSNGLRTAALHACTGGTMTYAKSTASFEKAHQFEALDPWKDCPNFSVAARSSHTQASFF